jgi:hypothetical protein
MTSAYHLWPVDRIGGGLLIFITPGLFFMMMGILILIKVIVGWRMPKLGYYNNENSNPSLRLIVILGIILCIIIIALFNIP